MLYVMKEYASFFEWPDRQRKELGVVEELVNGLKHSGQSTLSGLRAHHPDPPDCVCEDADGRTVAIEVSEIVCERAASLTAKGDKVMRLWRKGELANHIADKLAEKDKKTFHGGPYSAILICLHTDEPLVTKEQAVEELAAVSFGPYLQITSAYLLLSYDPHSRSYPFSALRIKT